MQEFILENKKFIYICGFFLLIALISGIIAVVFYLKWHDSQENEPILLSDNFNEKSQDSEKNHFFIEIKGAVNNPDVYEITEGEIVKDAINYAGGFLENAYTDNINMSKLLENEMVIYVFTKEMYEKIKSDENNNNICEVCDCDKYIVEPSIDNSIITSDSNQESENVQNTLININIASLNELMLLPGIGESKAQNIIAYRTENGNFKNIEDIKNVSGIGDLIYEQIKEFITVS